MSKQPVAPHFDEEFWMTVHRRVDRVREITREELVQAQDQLLAVEAPEAEVVPVFTGPFWARVNKRAAKVRNMALDELADAEERLIRQPATAGSSARRRTTVPAAGGRLRHLLPLAIPLKVRTNALGFVTALIAVLLILPQVVPISSVAGVKPGGPLAIFFSSEEPEEPAPSETSSGSRVESAGSDTAKQAAPARSAAEKTESSRPGETAAARNGSPGATDAAKGGSNGATGSAGQASAGATAPAAAGGEGSSSAGGVSAGSAPASPSSLMVTAVDDTKVRLRWKDNSSDETGFEIERRGQTTVGRQTTDSDMRSYIWTGLSPGTEFCFRVRASNGAGSSDWFPEQYRCVTTHRSQTSPGPVALTPISCSNEGNMSAGADLQESELVVRNLTSQTVKIYALSRSGARTPMGVSLPAQGSATISTFVGHPYVITTGDDSSSCLAIFSPESWSSVATITPPPA